MGFLLATAVQFWSVCQACPPVADTEHVSIIQLIATPERYQGKRLVVTGFLTIQRENDSLCMTKEASAKDCLWVEFDEGPYNADSDLKRYKTAEATWMRFSGKRVTIRGTFNKENTGHLGGWSGALEHITDAFTIE